MIVAEAGATILTLVGRRYAVAAVAGRWQRVRPVVTSSPVAPVVDGQVQRRALSASRISHGKMADGLRKADSGPFGDVAWVVLETDGTLAVEDAADGSALRDGRVTPPAV